MKTNHFPLLVVALLCFVLPGISAAGPISSTDLWDVSQGSIVDGTSGALYYNASYWSDVANMFGASLGTIEAGNTLFKDYMSPGFQGGSVPAGYTHYVEWHTAIPVTLRSLNLHASNEGMDRRAFNRFELYSSGTAGGPWTTIYDTGPGYTYGPGVLDLETNITPVVAQYFRAEFIQSPWTSSSAVGPRIMELDGFNTFLDGSVPEPSAFLILIMAVAGLFSICRQPGSQGMTKHVK